MAIRLIVTTRNGDTGGVSVRQDFAVDTGVRSVLQALDGDEIVEVMVCDGDRVISSWP